MCLPSALTEIAQVSRQYLIRPYLAELPAGKNRIAFGHLGEPEWVFQAHPVEEGISRLRLLGHFGQNAQLPLTYTAETVTWGVSGIQIRLSLSVALNNCCLAARAVIPT